MAAVARRDTMKRRPDSRRWRSRPSSEPERRNKGQRKRRRPRSAPPVGTQAGSSGVAPNQSPFMVNPYEDLRAISKSFYFGGGFKTKVAKRFKRVLKEEEPQAAKSMTTESDDKPEEFETEAEHTQSSSKSVEVHTWNLLKANQPYCFFCNFRALYSHKMNDHLQSDFHREIVRQVRKTVSTRDMKFLEEYLLFKIKLAEDHRGVIEDTTIQQLHKKQDLTQGLGMEHFVKKVEIIHCVACDLFIPIREMNQHLKSQLHALMRPIKMDDSIKTAMTTARCMLVSKRIAPMLEQYRQGRNPFVEDEEDSGPVDMSSIDGVYIGAAAVEDRPYACEAYKYTGGDRAQKMKAKRSYQ